MAVWWTNTSGAPSRVMNPKPFASLNHFTVPFSIAIPFVARPHVGVRAALRFCWGVSVTRKVDDRPESTRSRRLAIFSSEKGQTRDLRPSESLQLEGESIVRPHVSQA